MTRPPGNPDIKHELKQQLQALSGRAFELLAGELLVYIGLERVSVTRLVGDGGIDAEGDLIVGTFQIPVGVQFKRYRKNVQRVDIDRFIGALSGRFAQGLFITTAGYGKTAQHKAATSIPHVLLMNGDTVVALMLKHRLGVQSHPGDSERVIIDPEYFRAFELQRQRITPHLAESGEAYQSQDPNPRELTPEEDLISLRALSYALRVDWTTVRRWIDQGKVAPDATLEQQGQTSYLFKRTRIEDYRTLFAIEADPASSAEWRQEFLDYAASRLLTKSYKPVVLKALLTLADRSGQVHMADLVCAFRTFYVERQQAGEPPEYGGPMSENPADVPDNEVRRLLLKYPLDRFLIKKYVQYERETDIIQIAPVIWNELRYYDVLDLFARADEQITYYYNRGS
jgi:hypothetical protein